MAMRFVVDEAAVDCDDLDEVVVRDSLRRLAVLLGEIREVDAGPIGILSGWGERECWRGVDLASVLGIDHLLGRDDSLLLLGLLGKCANIDDDDAVQLPEVSVDGGSPYESWATAFVHGGLSGSSKQARAVVSLAHVGRTGCHTVERDGQEAKVVFVVDFEDERLLWRSAYTVEDVPEARFFELAPRAFPGLVFAPTLRFGRFRGSYQALRGEVVRHLSALNDEWTEVLEAIGDANAISARVGIDVSRESPRTRASEGLMRQRDVDFRGQTYRCEWHSKLEPARNRIHFYPTDESLDGMLIGIFCEHLQTEG